MQNSAVIIGVIRMRLQGISYPACQARHHIGSWTAQDIMRKYHSLGRSLDELETMTPGELEKLFYPPMDRQHLKISPPDFEALIKKTESPGRKVYGEDLWAEYHKQEPRGFSRTMFYLKYREYRREKYGSEDLTMGVNRIPGERVYIDYCGDHALIHIMNLSEDPTDLTEQQEIHLFLTTCGFSSKIYAEASLDEKQAQFNAATAHALTYYGAAPKYLVPDNLRTGITVNTKDEVIVNAAYQDLEDFYDVIVLSPPYRKPRGKATAERYVQVMERKIVDQLQKQYVFQSLEEVNELVMEIAEAENNTIPRGYQQTHNELFELYDRPAMRPLREGEFEACDYRYWPDVSNQYHVAYDDHFYSVPCKYYGSQVVIKATPSEIIITDLSNKEIARHKRSYIPSLRYITKPEHMPANHRFYAEVNQRDSSYYLKWAEEIGPYMKQMIFMVLKSAKHDDQMYTACNGILHMCDGIPRGICEEAAADCVRGKRCRYHDFQSTLSDLLKQRKQSSITASLPDLEDVRGKDYYK